MHNRYEAKLKMDWKRTDRKPRVLVFVNPIENGFFDESFGAIINAINAQAECCKFIIGDSSGAALLIIWALDEKVVQEKFLERKTKAFTDGLHNAVSKKRINYICL